MMQARPARWIPDAAAALLLFAVVVGYLAALPLNLLSPDEARYLDHAKRVLDGEVLYRDIFDISTPGWVLLMAAAFGVFDATLAVARDVAAVIHGATAIVLFAICRRLDVRRGLAWACALSAVVLPQYVFPGATYHWLATFLCTVTILLCLVRARGPWWRFATGAVLGLIIAVHQHRGAVFSAGIAAWLVAEWAVDRLYGGRRTVAALTTELVALIGGVVAVLVPLFIALAAWAGADPLWQCLIATPLMNYRKALDTTWGRAWSGMTAWSAVIEYAPLALVPTAAVAVVCCWRRTAPEVARRHVFLTIVGATSLLSVSYFPDIVHFALIAPVFLIMVADLVELGLDTLPGPTSRLFGATVALAVVASVAVTARQWVATQRDLYRMPYATAFGRVDLAAEMHGVEIGWLKATYFDQLRSLLDDVPGRVLYVHPRAIYTNLLVGAHNPTRYDLVWAPVYTPPDQMEELIAALRTKRVPYIVWSPTDERPNRYDLVTQYILAHYERVSKPHMLADSLWKLKTDSQDARTPNTD